MPRDHVVALIGVGAMLLAIAIGATTRTYFDLFLRALLLSFCLLAAQLYVVGQLERFAEKFAGSAGAIGASLGRFASVLIWASLSWSIVRWRRRNRQIREEIHRQLVLHEKLRGAPLK